MKAISLYLIAYSLSRRNYSRSRACQS